MTESAIGPFQTHPRLVRWVGIPMTALFLILFFVYLGFPYDRLTQYVLKTTDRNPEIAISVGSAASNIEWLGPGIALEDVVISHPDSPRIHLDRIALRPAWSFSWFRGVPAIHGSFETRAGEIDATVQLENPLRLYGTFVLTDATRLPLPDRTPEIPLRGEVAVDFDMTAPLDDRIEAWEGTFDLESEEGSIAIQDFPVLIPYTNLEGRVRLGGDQLVLIEGGRMEGPLVNATLSGTINGERLDPTGTLQIEFITETDDESVQKAIRNMGFAVDPQGKTHVQIDGTLEKPSVGER